VIDDESGGADEMWSAHHRSLTLSQSELIKMVHTSVYEIAELITKFTGQIQTCGQNIGHTQRARPRSEPTAVTSLMTSSLTSLVTSSSSI